MYQLLNDMVGGDDKGKLVSQHKSLVAAMRANQRLQRKVKAGNGQSSYLPTRILSNWSPVDEYEWAQAEQEVFCR